jgi:phosphoribosylamine-glycine ligase
MRANIKDAREKAYRALKEINFEGMHYRKDIGEI